MQTAMAELLALLQPYRNPLLLLLFSQPFPAQKKGANPYTILWTNFSGTTC